MTIKGYLRVRKVASFPPPETLLEGEIIYVDGDKVIAVKGLGSGSIFRFPLIMDSTISDTTTWSSEKIEEEILSKAPQDHDHDDRYYTKDELQTSGSSQVHSGNIDYTGKKMEDLADVDNYPTGGKTYVAKGGEGNIVWEEVTVPEKLSDFSEIRKEGKKGYLVTNQGSRTVSIRDSVFFGRTFIENHFSLLQNDIRTATVSNQIASYDFVVGKSSVSALAGNSNVMYDVVEPQGKVKIPILFGPGTISVFRDDDEIPEKTSDLRNLLPKTFRYVGNIPEQVPHPLFLLPLNGTILPSDMWYFPIKIDSEGNTFDLGPAEKTILLTPDLYLSEGILEERMIPTSRNIGGFGGFQLISMEASDTNAVYLVPSPISSFHGNFSDVNDVMGNKGIFVTVTSPQTYEFQGHGSNDVVLAFRLTEREKGSIALRVEGDGQVIFRIVKEEKKSWIEFPTIGFSSENVVDAPAGDIKENICSFSFLIVPLDTDTTELIVRHNGDICRPSGRYDASILPHRFDTITVTVEEVEGEWEILSFNAISAYSGILEEVVPTPFSRTNVSSVGMKVSEDVLGNVRSDEVALLEIDDKSEENHLVPFLFPKEGSGIKIAREMKGTREPVVGINASQGNWIWVKGIGSDGNSNILLDLKHLIDAKYGNREYVLENYSPFILLDTFENGIPEWEKINIGTDSIFGVSNTYCEELNGAIAIGVTYKWTEWWEEANTWNAPTIRHGLGDNFPDDLLIGSRVFSVTVPDQWWSRFAEVSIVNKNNKRGIRITYHSSPDEPNRMRIFSSGNRRDWGTPSELPPELASEIITWLYTKIVPDGDTKHIPFGMYVHHDSESEIYVGDRITIGFKPPKEDTVLDLRATTARHDNKRDTAIGVYDYVFVAPAIRYEREDFARQMYSRNLGELGKVHVIDTELRSNPTPFGDKIVHLSVSAVPSFIFKEIKFSYEYPQSDKIKMAFVVGDEFWNWNGTGWERKKTISLDEMMTLEDLNTINGEDYNQILTECRGRGIKYFGFLFAGDTNGGSEALIVRPLLLVGKLDDTAVVWGTGTDQWGREREDTVLRFAGTLPVFSTYGSGLAGD